MFTFNKSFLLHWVYLYFQIVSFTHMFVLTFMIQLYHKQNLFSTPRCTENNTLSFLIGAKTKSFLTLKLHSSSKRCGS